MSFFLGRVRHLAAGTIGAGSIIAGVVLAFRLVTPALVERLPTFELLGLLGLLILPLLTLWALATHRRAAARVPALRPEPIHSHVVEPKPLTVLDDDFHTFDNDITSAAEVEIHAPGRRTVRHRRHDPSRTIA
jgi:hypothetical protein